MTFLRLVRVEFIKTMRMRSTYIAFAAVGLHIVIVQLGVYFGADRSRFYQFLVQFGFDTTLLVNGFVATRVAMEVGFPLLIAPMVILTFARQIAAEDQRGTLRMMLSRPIGRAGLINAKFAVCALYCLLLMGFFLGASYGMGVALFGSRDSVAVGKWTEFRDLRSVQKQMKRSARDESEPEDDAQDPRGAISDFIITPRQCMARLAILAPLAAWSLMTVGAIAFFFSTFNRHPIAAMALTIGVYFLVMIVERLAGSDNLIPIFQRLKPYLFTTEMDYWRGCFSHEIHWRDFTRGAGLLGGYTAFFFGLGHWIFSRRDLKN